MLLEIHVNKLRSPTQGGIIYMILSVEEISHVLFRSGSQEGCGTGHVAQVQPARAGNVL